MFILNADPHGNYNKIIDFCNKFDMTRKDTIILLGDVAFNYLGDERDKIRQQQLSSLPCNFLCIHGNHEMRPSTLPQYKLINYNGGKVWVDDIYPNVMFAKDGDVYNLDGNKCMAIGGAYSVDKPYRLIMGYNWFDDEQPSSDIKNYVESQLNDNNWNMDYIFSHTCPICYEPKEMFINSIDNNTIDKSTEQWLGGIEYKLNYKKWYCGHFHTDKNIDRIRFIFNDFIELGK